MQDAIALIQGSPGVGNRDVMIGEYGIPNDSMDTTVAADLTAVANGGLPWASAPSTGRSIIRDWPRLAWLVRILRIIGPVCFTGFAGRQSKCRHGRDLRLSSQNDCLGRQAPPAIPRKAFFEFTPETLPSGPE